MLRTIVKFLLLVAVLGSAAAAGWWWYAYHAAQVDVHTVGRGDIVVGVTVSGAIESRQKSAVAAEIVALLDKLVVDEGQAVKKGDSLVELDAAVILAERGKAEANLDRARAHLAELEKSPRREEEDHAAELVKQAASRLDYAKRQLELIERLVKQGNEMQSQLDLAKSRKEVAEAELNAAKAQQALLKPRQEQIDRAEADVKFAKAELNRCNALQEKYVLRAEHDGIVTARHVNVGEVVSPGQVLLRVDNNSDLRVRAQVQETQLAGVRPGHVARVLTDAYPDKPLSAKVTEILPRVDPESGAVGVLLDLQAAGGAALMDGMAVDIAFVGGERKNVIRVPASAIEKVEGKTRVWVRSGASYQPREIQTGLAGVQWVEVVCGLEAGQVVRLLR